MKTTFIFWIVQIYAVAVCAQDIHQNSALVLPQNGTYTVASGQTVSITSGESITLLPGVHLQQGSTVTLKINNSPVVQPPPNIPADDFDKNWILSKSYDENGNPSAESKSFFDYTGKVIQSQVKNLTTGHVLANQVLYDVEGRAAAETLPAPINNGSFKYKNNFVSTSGGDPYTYKNFDYDAAVIYNPYERRTAPNVVGNTQIGTLGWYYSNNNTLESYVPTTTIPYSRTDYYLDGTGSPKHSAEPGDALRLGAGHNAYINNTFPVVNELDHYKAVRDRFFPEAVIGDSGDLEGNAIQNVAVDVNGVRSVNITDLTGKPLMTARGDENGWLTVNNSVQLDGNKNYTTDNPVDYEFSFHMGPSTTVYNEISTFSISSTYNVWVFRNGVQVYYGIGNLFDFDTYKVYGADYKVTSRSPFLYSYVTGWTPTCQDCPARAKEPQTSSVHYFHLLTPSVVGLTQSSGSNFTVKRLGNNTYTLDINTEYAAAPYRFDAYAGDFTLTYSNKYSDISYNFYNQLGQLIATVAPEGVKKLIDNINAYTTAEQIPFVNLTKYDLQGRVISETTADAGKSEFVYRKDGNIRFSQNAEQVKTGKFSYTNYDRWDRPFESGEYLPGDITFQNTKYDETLLENTGSDGGLTGGTRLSWVKTHYDLPDNSHSLSTYVQDESFLKGGVSWTENANAKTWYNYDENGRVLWVIKYINGLGYKTIDYTYDAKGNAIKVDYQKSIANERFTHEYEYDADNRLSVVYTSASGASRKEQARYYYYLHGPLKRVELAENLQGIDYAYTPQGWLKSVNHPDNANDPGKDGANGFAPDAFGMTLEYFSGDYTRANTGISSLAAGTNKTFYNGTIVAQSWRSQKPQAVINAQGTTVNNPAMFTYEYDDKYQFNNNKYGVPNFGTNSFTEAVNQNREHSLSYDANGNIQSMVRTNKDGNTVNNLTYNYTSNTNKLASVSNYASYQYDDLGQMTGEQKTAGGGYYLDYDVSGKVTAIYSDAGKTQLKVSFVYDESGMRIKKTDHVQNVSTYYVYDASGNVLALYDNNGTALQQKEVPVYASGRIGTYNKQNSSYQYELTDHLGNVRVVIGQSKTASGNADVITYSDYYPYGSPMTLASNDYRYGYQGKYAEADKETGWNNFQLRMYDPVVARWMSTDPKKQYASPYIGMGNNPVSGVDPDGGEKDDIIFQNNKGKEIGRIVTPGNDVYVKVNTDFTTSHPFKLDPSALEKSIGRHLDAVGLGFELSGTYAAGLNTGVEFVYFLNGKDKGNVFGYEKLGVNVGVEVTAGVYGFGAWNNKSSNSSGASWNGVFNSYSVGASAVGVSYFWSNNDNKIELYPTMRSQIAWQGVAVTGTIPVSTGFKMGGKWSATNYWPMNHGKPLF